MNVRIQGWSSEVERSPNMHEAVGSFLITTKMCRDNWRVGSVVRVQILSTYKQWAGVVTPSTHNDGCCLPYTCNPSAVRVQSQDALAGLQVREIRWNAAEKDVSCPLLAFV